MRSATASRCLSLKTGRETRLSRPEMPRPARRANCLFASTKPTNEEDLQDKIHAILLGHMESFEREHPAIRFLGKGLYPRFLAKTPAAVHRSQRDCEGKSAPT